MTRKTKKQWRMAKLSEVADINPRSFSKPANDADIVSFVPMKAVEEESGKLSAEAMKPWGEVRKGYTPFQDGDVIFAKITPCMENGKYALAKGLHGGRAAGSTEFHVFRPKADLDAAFLLQFLFSDTVRRDARMNMRGAAGQLRVPTTFFEELEIPVPPIDEQRRIVAEIEKQFTRLDAGVAALHRVQANLKRYRVAVLKAACEGRLVPTEAELTKSQKQKIELETGDILLARIFATAEVKPLGKAKLKQLETSGDSVALSEGWASAPLERLAEVVDPNPKHRNPSYVEKGFPFLSTAQFSKGKGFDLTTAKTVTLETVVEQERRCHFSSRSIAFSRKGTIGKTRFVPTDHRFALLDSLCVINASPEISADYLNIALNSAFVQRQVWQRVRGVALKQISVGGVRELRIPIPPFAEQTRIVAEAERRLSVIDELESVVTANLTRATRLRQSILQKAFSGNPSSGKLKDNDYES